MESRIQSLEDQLKAAKVKTPPGAKKVKGGGKKSIQGILKKKGDPAVKKTTALCAPRAPRDAQDENSMLWAIPLRRFFSPTLRTRNSTT